MAQKKDPDFTPDPDFKPTDTVGSKIARAAGYVPKGLDYQGGAVRGAVGRQLGLVTPEEADKAVSMEGAWPSSAEMLKRAGMGGEASPADLVHYLPLASPETKAMIWGLLKNSWADVSARDALGFVSDVVTDPLTYETGGASAIARPLLSNPKTWAKAPLWLQERVARGPQEVISGLGKTLYERGLRPVMEFGERKGKDVADVFYRHGIWSTKNLGSTVSQKTASLKKSRDAIQTAADGTGARVKREAAFDPMFKELAAMVDNRLLTPDEAEKLLDDFSERYYRGADPTTTEATGWKTQVRRGLPSTAWDNLKHKSPDEAERIARATGKGLQEETEATVGRALGPEKQKEFKRLNSDLGTFLTTHEKANALGNQHKPILNLEDYLVLTGEMQNRAMGGPVPPGLMIGTKKTFDILRRPEIQVPLGYGLQKLGRGKFSGPATSTGARRWFLDQSLTNQVKEDPDFKPDPDFTPEEKK